MIFLVSSGKMLFLFPENMIFFYGRKMKDDLSKKIHGNMMFSICWYMVVFIPHTNTKLPFCQKSKDDLSTINACKNDISRIT